LVSPSQRAPTVYEVNHQPSPCSKNDKVWDLVGDVVKIAASNRKSYGSGWRDIYPKAGRHVDSPTSTRLGSYGRCLLNRVSQSNWAAALVVIDNAMDQLFYFLLEKQELFTTPAATFNASTPVLQCENAMKCASAH